MEVTEIRTDESTSEDEVLERAVSVEEVSQHPVAEALREELEERKEDGTEVRKREVSEPRVRPGEGVRASVGDEETAVGSRSLLEDSEFDMGSFDGDEGGDNVVYVGWDGKVRGSVRVEEELRPGWRRVLGGLRDDGFDVVLLTGDGS
ncbi:MAG: HAD family hydrolase, partial [Halobacteria archaeon]|nr:HAD family hydrolase [Halobacteria archaeon]